MQLQKYFLKIFIHNPNAPVWRICLDICGGVINRERSRNLSSLER